MSIKIKRTLLCLVMLVPILVFGNEILNPVIKTNTEDRQQIDNPISVGALIVNQEAIFNKLFITENNKIRIGDLITGAYSNSIQVQLKKTNLKTAAGARQYCTTGGRCFNSKQLLDMINTIKNQSPAPTCSNASIKINQL